MPWNQSGPIKRHPLYNVCPKILGGGGLVPPLSKLCILNRNHIRYQRTSMTQPISAWFDGMFLGIPDMAAWECVVSCMYLPAHKQQLAIPLQFQSWQYSWSSFPSSGALYYFSLLFPPLATLLLETVPLVTVQVRRVHASTPTCSYVDLHIYYEN